MANGERPEPRRPRGERFLLYAAAAAGIAGAIAALYGNSGVAFVSLIFFIALASLTIVAYVLDYSMHDLLDYSMHDLIELVRDLKRIRHLGEAEIIRVKFADLVRRAKHIIFFGPLDEDKAQIFIDWIDDANRRGRVDEVSINIFNTDTNIYGRPNAKQLLDTLIELDKRHETFNSYHSFNYRSHVHLRTADGDHRLRSLLIFDAEEGNKHALLIKNRRWVPVPDPDDHNVFPIHFFQQAEEIADIDRDFWKYTDPLKRGWISPIFPPMNDTVRRECRRAILNWFNSTAVSLVQSVKTEVLITWLIGYESARDAIEFHAWLELIRRPSQFDITRFLLIDYQEFKKEQSYRDIVLQIWNSYLPKTGSSRYKIKVLDSHNLPQELKKDIALIKAGSMVYAQNSESDSSAGSSVEILRIFFSRTQVAVSDFRRRFNALEERFHPEECSTFEACTDHIFQAARS